MSRRQRTAPEPYECPHGVLGGLYVWEWDEEEGETEEDSDIVILETSWCDECEEEANEEGPE